MAQFTIYINEAKFTADDTTIDLVIEALEEKGFTYDPVTEGYISPGFYDDDDTFPFNEPTVNNEIV